MSDPSTVREYGRIVAGGDARGLDVVPVGERAFAYFRSLAYGKGAERDEHARLFHPSRHEGQEALQVRNYVGILQSPCGTQLEVLPKIAGADEIAAPQALPELRRLLIRMLSVAGKVPLIRFRETDVATTSRPLLEVFIGQFLLETQPLLLRGLLGGYVDRRDTLPTIKGKIAVSAQLRRARPSHTSFELEFSEFATDRPENRLIKSALLMVLRWTRHGPHQRLARELLDRLEEVGPSVDVKLDLVRCVRDRTTAHYAVALDWCALILSSLSPIFMGGSHGAISLLFPMEQLFEQFVARSLQRQFPGWQIRAQAHSEYLVTHGGRGLFNLKPDLLIRADGGLVVADTKWKLLDSRLDDPRDTYGLSQSDFYQLYAYGHKYLAESVSVKQLWLIYPANPHFSTPLPEFWFHDDFLLRVLPFNLDTGELAQADPFPVPVCIKA